MDFLYLAADAVSRSGHRVTLELAADETSMAHEIKGDRKTEGQGRIGLQQCFDIGKNGAGDAWHADIGKRIERDPADILQFVGIMENLPVQPVFVRRQQEETGGE